MSRLYPPPAAPHVSGKQRHHVTWSDCSSSSSRCWSAGVSWYSSQSQARRGLSWVRPAPGCRRASASLHVSTGEWPAAAPAAGRPAAGPRQAGPTSVPPPPAGPPCTRCTCCERIAAGSVRHAATASKWPLKAGRQVHSSSFCCRAPSSWATSNWSHWRATFASRCTLHQTYLT